MDVVAPNSRAVLVIQLLPPPVSVPREWPTGSLLGASLGNLRRHSLRNAWILSAVSMEKRSEVGCTESHAKSAESCAGHTA